MFQMSVKVSTTHRVHTHFQLNQPVSSTSYSYSHQLYSYCDTSSHTSVPKSVTQIPPHYHHSCPWTDTWAGFDNTTGSPKPFETPVYTSGCCLLYWWSP